MSRKELKKLDEEAEYEFAQIIAANKELSCNNFANVVKTDEPVIVVNDYKDTVKDSVVECDEKRLSVQLYTMKQSPSTQFNDFKAFTPNRSNYSINTNQPTQMNCNNLSGSINVKNFAPSIVVMDAVRRRSRTLLYSSRLPTNVYSMPQISHYNSNNKSNNNVTGLNEDSNV